MHLSCDESYIKKLGSFIYAMTSRLARTIGLEDTLVRSGCSGMTRQTVLMEWKA